MTSSRADLDRLSFLDLPAEVRNEVYGYAFEHPSPIVITFSEQVSGSVTLHRYIGDSNHELPLLRSRPDNAYLPKAQALVVDSRGELRQIYTIVRPCDTIQAFPMGLPFFQTCRQVHDEASSSFYSNNTFLIMQKRLGCATKHGKKCDLAGRVLELWCRQIRAYIKLVKHLWLDIDSICSFPGAEQKEDDELWIGGRRPMPHQGLNFTKFVMEFLRLQLRTKFTVVHVDGQADPARADDRPFYPEPKMQQMVEALCKDDLGLKRYRHTLARIYVAPDGSSGRALFWSTARHQCHKMEVEYETSNSGRPMHACPDSAAWFYLDNAGVLASGFSATHILPNLPSRLQHKILDMILPASEPITIDVADTTDLTTVATPLYLNQSLRENCLDSMPNRSYVLKVTSTSATFQCPDMSRLGRFLDTRIDHDFWGDTTPWCFGIDADIQVLLEVQLDIQVDLDDLRMGIVPSILDLSSTWNHNEITFDLFTPANQRALTMTLGLLRRRVLKALKAFRKDRATDGKFELCPEVWINGRGVVKDVVKKKLPTSEVGDLSMSQSSSTGFGDEDVDLGPKVKPPFPTAGRLDGTIRDLEWAIRHWQRAQ